MIDRKALREEWQSYLDVLFAAADDYEPERDLEAPMQRAVKAVIDTEAVEPTDFSWVWQAGPTTMEEKTYVVEVPGPGRYIVLEVSDD